MNVPCGPGSAPLTVVRSPFGVTKSSVPNHNSETTTHQKHTKTTDAIEPLALLTVCGCGRRHPPALFGASIARRLWCLFFFSLSLFFFFVFVWGWLVLVW